MAPGYSVSSLVRIFDQDRPSTDRGAGGGHDSQHGGLHHEQEGHNQPDHGLWHWEVQHAMGKYMTCPAEAR